MNNPTYLQRQYTKLTQKLQKAYQSGKFYQYTQYKQSQLLDKLASYTLQLKKLGMAAAVVTGVGMATPAVGQQIPFLFTTHLDTFLKSDGANFVDIDGDGDLDIVGFHTVYNGVTQRSDNYYFENVGSTTQPNYLQRTKLLSVDDVNNPVFVDIDGDGDLDCFAGKYRYYNYYSGTKQAYYENIGTATIPSFVERTGNLNPLDSVNQHQPQQGFQSNNFGSGFSDIDGDGDSDYFIYRSTNNLGAAVLDFYENTGTATSPIFLRQTTSNPLSQFSVSSRILTYGSLNFHDGDLDGDFDVLIRSQYYENTGSATNPIFVEQIGSDNPYDTLVSPLSATASPDLRSIVVVDIDGDGDLDVSVGSGFYNSRNLYENRTIVLSLPKVEQQKINLTISPNPTTGDLQLDRPITGAMEIFNTAGQVVQSAQLNEEQVIDLGELTNGIYFLKVQTLEGLISEKIIISK